MALSQGIAKHSAGARQFFQTLSSEIRLSLKTQEAVSQGRRALLFLPVLPCYVTVYSKEW